MIGLGMIGGARTTVSGTAAAVIGEKATGGTMAETMAGTMGGIIGGTKTATEDATTIDTEKDSDKGVCTQAVNVQQ